MLKIFPFSTGSAVTASFAITASYAESVVAVSSSAAVSASFVLEPNPGLPGPVGSPAAKDLCLVSYDDWVLYQTSPHLYQIICGDICPPPPTAPLSYIYDWCEDPLEDLFDVYVWSDSSGIDVDCEWGGEGTPPIVFSFIDSVDFPQPLYSADYYVSLGGVPEHNFDMTGKKVVFRVSGWPHDQALFFSFYLISPQFNGVWGEVTQFYFTIDSGKFPNILASAMYGAITQPSSLGAAPAELNWRYDPDTMQWFSCKHDPVENTLTFSLGPDGENWVDVLVLQDLDPLTVDLLSDMYIWFDVWSWPESANDMNNMNFEVGPFQLLDYDA